MLPPYFLKLSLIPALQVLLKNDFILWFCNGNSRHSITYSLQNKIRMQLRGLFHPISIAFSHHQKLAVDFSRDYSSLHSLCKYVTGIIVNLYSHVNPFSKNAADSSAAFLNTYSNHSVNKLITLFFKQFATTLPKNPVF